MEDVSDSQVSHPRSGPGRTPENLSRIYGTEKGWNGNVPLSDGSVKRRDATTIIFRTVPVGKKDDADQS